MAIHPINGIELFSGTGMLGEGFRAGLEYLGIPYRSVCHVEREAYPAAVLAARMEEGSLHPAPIWSDVTTFDARAWRGKVDCIVAGFPCQDLSVAGKRAGLDGKRSGLFFEICRIASDSGAWLMLLENVAGIASATASVVDEAEGELEERAAARVMGELADLGWDAEWLHLRALDVGASHSRERWFCVAWLVADDGLQHGKLQQWQVRAEHPRGSINVDAAQRAELGRTCNCNRGGQEAYGSISELCGLFAPGPADPRWADIIREHPHLAPALEPVFRGVVNGLAADMDDCRAKRLKCAGNGVVAVQCAAAVVVLFRRAGIA